VAIVSETTPREYIDYLERRHVKHIVAGKDKVDLVKALEALSSTFKAKCVRVDSGGTLNGLLLRQGLVDEVSVVVHPFLVGGTSLKYFFVAEDLKRPEDAIDLKLIDVKKLERGHVWMRYKVRKGTKGSKKN